MSDSTKSALIKGAVGIGVLVVALLAILVTIAFINNSHNPEAAVREYVELIAQGKATEATELVDPPILNADRLLLSDEGVAANTAPMEVLSVTELDTNRSQRDEANVEVVFSLDGERQEPKIIQVKRGPNKNVVFKTWEVETPLIYDLTVSAAGVPALMIGDVTVPVSSGGADDAKTQSSQKGQTVTLKVYPGVYNVKPSAGSSKYITADPVAIQVPTVKSTPVAKVEAQPTDELKTFILKAVAEKVQSCASISGNMEADCPNEVQRTDLDSIDVTKLPDKVTELSLTNFKTNEGIITIRRNPTSYNKNPSPDPVRFTVSGNIQWPDGKDDPAIELGSLH